MTIPSVPFDDDQLIGRAGLDQDEPNVCLEDPFFELRDSSPTVLPFPDGTVWYRYTALADRVLHVSAWRMVGSEGRLGVFRVVGSELELIGCAKGQDDEYDGSGSNETDMAEILFQAREGEEYLFQVAEEGKDDYLVTSFRVRDAAVDDLTLTDLDIIKTAAGVRISVKAEGERAQLLLQACQSTEASTCSVIYRSSLAYGYYDHHWDVQWEPAWCLGDMTIQASLGNPFAIDPNLSNNEASQATWVALDGPGVCAIR